MSEIPKIIPPSPIATNVLEGWDKKCGQNHSFFKTIFDATFSYIFAIEIGNKVFVNMWYSPDPPNFPIRAVKDPTRILIIYMTYI
jgi:hypothetical protein